MVALSIPKIKAREKGIIIHVLSLIHRARSIFAYDVCHEFSDAAALQTRSIGTVIGATMSSSSPKSKLQRHSCLSLL